MSTFHILGVSIIQASEYQKNLGKKFIHLYTLHIQTNLNKVMQGKHYQGLYLYHFCAQLQCCKVHFILNG